MRHRLAWSVLASLSLVGSALAAPTTMPATMPTSAPRRLVPTDLPSVKMGRDGNPDKGFLAKHEKFLARGKAGPIGVLFLGDSITDFWTKAPDVWKAHYGTLNAANFGISGDRTEHVLWRIENGELDGVHPKVLVLMIGTNNAGDTVAHILNGDRKIVAEIHRKLPDTKLLLLGIFPRGADPADKKVAALRAKIKAVNAELAKLDDGKQTRYLDIGDRFLNADGVLTKEIMPDALHPNVKGYQIWADAMQPLLEEMLKPN